MQETLILREGDVFAWRYRDDLLQKWKNSTTLYWCEDRQVIVRQGRLCDTYWAGLDLAPDGSEHVKQPEDLVLDFVCNLHDVRRISPHDVKYYAPEDVFDLTYHAGYKPFFAVRPDAERNQAAMLRYVEQAQQQADTALRSAARRQTELADLHAQITAGNLHVHLP